MGMKGLKFYRSDQYSFLSGPLGLIECDDVVLIKVNAQWKYRGCTNSDLVRGLIQRILDHPDGFTFCLGIIFNVSLLHQILPIQNGRVSFQSNDRCGNIAGDSLY